MDDSHPDICDVLIQECQALGIPGKDVSVELQGLNSALAMHLTAAVAACCSTEVVAAVAHYNAFVAYVHDGTSGTGSLGSKYLDSSKGDSRRRGNDSDSQLLCSLSALQTAQQLPGAGDFSFQQAIQTTGPRGGFNGTLCSDDGDGKVPITAASWQHC